MKRLIGCALRLVLVLLATVFWHASAHSSPSRSQLAKQLETYLEVMVEEHGFSGSVLVAKEGTPIVSRGYGMANLEWQVPNSPRTVFRLGSLTKQFTAIGVVMLRERGALKLSDPICRYLDDQLSSCPKAWQAITVRQLLTHTSGLPDFATLPDVAARAALPIKPKSLVRRVAREHLAFTPGKDFIYSNTNYYLLGLIIERVTKMTYAEFLQETVFEPLKMTHSGYDDTTRIIAGRASGYSAQGDVLKNSAYVDMSNAFASGGLISTTEDLLRWDTALYTNKLVSAAARKEMFTPTSVGELLPGIGYAYGWGVGQWYGYPALLHNGGISGFSDFIARLPSEHLTVIVLSNVEQTPAFPLAQALAGIALGEAPPE